MGSDRHERIRSLILKHGGGSVSDPTQTTLPHQGQGDATGSGGENPGVDADEYKPKVIKPSVPAGSTSQYGGYYGGSSHGGGYKPQPPAGVIHWMTEDGTVAFTTEVRAYDSDIWDSLEYTYPSADGIMQIPLTAADMRFDTPKFLPCSFDSTKDYLEARWGRKLHVTDKDWLAAHPNATDDGLPFEYTPNALSQLVEPYGMRISRIRVKQGKLLIPDTVLQWATILGCNPLGLADHSTSNDEALKVLSVTPEYAAQNWRFEFHAEPLRPAILAERGAGDRGHDRYLAPRDRWAMGWEMAIQLAPASEVPYFAEPVLPEYKPRRGPATVTLSGTKGPDGTRCLRKEGAWTHPAGPAAEAKLAAEKALKAAEGGATTRGRSAGVARGVSDVRLNPGKNSESPKHFMCTGCNRVKKISMLKVGVSAYCQTCYEWDWSSYSCPACKAKMKNHPPSLRGRDFDAKRTYYECGNKKCRTAIVIDDAEHWLDHRTLVEQALMVWRPFVERDREAEDAVVPTV